MSVRDDSFNSEFNYEEAETAEWIIDNDDFSDRNGRLDQSTEADEFILTRVSTIYDNLKFEALRFNKNMGLLRIFPATVKNGISSPQFERVTELQIECPNWNWANHSAEHGQFGFLYAKGLPKGFSAVYEFGLGIARDYRHMVDQIEARTTCVKVKFTRGGPEGLDESGAVFRVTLDRFGKYRSAVDLSRARGQTAVRRVIDADDHNAIADLFDLDLIEPKYTRNPVIKSLTEEVATGHVTSPSDRTRLADELTTAAPALGQEAPERLVKLRGDIELVSLDKLIEQFEIDLSGTHSRSEDHWQEFFNNNRFALQLIFSTPIVVERQHAEVQAGDIDGRGARITDFLCANTVARTIVIVEIKTPGAVLMAANPYRGSNSASAVYPPHLDLAGPVSQLQSQMASVPQSLASRLTPDLDLDPWNDIRGAVIAGRVSTLSGSQRESFLRYRAGLATLTILGYDEVLDRLKALRKALISAPANLTE